MSGAFFDGWAHLLRSVLTAAAIYLVIVAALRMVGEKALAKMSGYDMIVTVALGSLVAAIPLTTSVSLVDAIAAAVTFLGLQQAHALSAVAPPPAIHIHGARAPAFCCCGTANCSSTVSSRATSPPTRCALPFAARDACRWRRCALRSSRTTASGRSFRSPTHRICRPWRGSGFRPGGNRNRPRPKPSEGRAAPQSAF